MALLGGTNHSDEMTPHPLQDLHWSTRWSALKRQGVALASALAAGMTAFHYSDDLIISILAAWCVYCAVTLALTSVLVHHTDADATRRHAQWNDPGAFLLFVWVVIAGCASLVAITFAISTGSELKGWARWGHLTLVFLSLVGAWLLIQTAFALHYARLYYRPFVAKAAPLHREQAHGLAFPGGREPDYLDFFYYSAVVGMTSQVSDVTVTSSSMRRLTLLQSLLSFGFNLIVLAIAVNVLASHLN